MDRSKWYVKLQDVSQSSDAVAVISIQYGGQVIKEIGLLRRYCFGRYMVNDLNFSTDDIEAMFEHDYDAMLYIITAWHLPAVLPTALQILSGRGEPW